MTIWVELWMYNMIVHSMTGMSSFFFFRSGMGLSESDRNLWGEASKRFASFNFGDKVSHPN